MSAFAARPAAAAAIVLVLASGFVPRALAQKGNPAPSAASSMSAPTAPGQSAMPAPPGQATMPAPPGQAAMPAPLAPAQPVLPATSTPETGTALSPLPLSPVLPKLIDPGALLKGTTPPPLRTAPNHIEARGVALDAKLTADGAAIPSGMIWRIFSENRGVDGHLQLVREQRGGSVRIDLPPGRYIVHAAYGEAGLARSISVTGTDSHETFVMNAGGLKLSAVIGKDQQIPPALSHFDLYPGGDEADNETTPIAMDISPDQTVRLSAGTYHVVSRYGDANAAVRANIKVEAGKLTEATLFQQAARITLRLVSETGGEALANTSWSVVTAGGDSVFDSVGAFPDVVLAIGDYTAVAKHDNQIHERNFTVEAGRDREVEVLAK